MEITELFELSIRRSRYEQIWGSMVGPLGFEKRESFADDLSALTLYVHSA